jgi:hypothetical protein
LLQLIPGQENVIADFATESLEGLIDISTQLPEKDSDSEKKFKKDYENTQKLLRKTLSTNFPSGLSNTEIVDFMSLKANESKSDGFHKLKHKLKKFMGERQNFYETSYKKEHSLQPCYYAYGQHFTYFGLNPKTTSMILKKIASLSHLSSLKRLVLNDLKLPWPDFKKDKKIPVLKGISKNLVEEFEKYPAWNHGIIGKGMLEALTHAWHPYGVQARVQVWERIANSARITPAESIGFHASPDNDTIHFLKINLQGDMLEHYIPMDVMEYDYTSTLFI